MVRAVFSVLAAFTVGFVTGSYFLPNMLGPAWLPFGGTTLGAICGLFFASITAVKEGRRLVRQRKIHRFAKPSSLRYAAKGTQSTADGIQRLTGESGRWWIENELMGRVDDVGMTVGDLFHSSSGEETTTTVRTVAHFQGGNLYFPHFTLQPNGKFLDFLGDLVGVRDIDFTSHPKFSEYYHLSSDQPETTRRIFSDKCLDHFTKNLGWQVRAQRDQIMITRDCLIPAEDLDPFIKQAQSILELFRHSVEKVLATTPESTTELPVESSTGQAAEKKSRPNPRREAGQPSDSGSEESSAHSPKGWLARRIAANTISWEEIERFVQLPTPRNIPKLIQRHRVKGHREIYIAILILVGLSVTPFFVVSIFATSLPIGAMLITGAVLIAVTAGIAALLKRKSRDIEVLRNGRLTSAEIVGVRSTGLEVNSNPQYEVELRYNVNGQSRQKKLKVYGEHGDLAYAFLDSGRETPLLVDSNNPDYCILGLQLSNPARVRL